MWRVGGFEAGFEVFEGERDLVRGMRQKNDWEG